MMLAEKMILNISCRSRESAAMQTQPQHLIVSFAAS